MEPVRGGRLASLEDSDEAILKSLRPDHTVPEWAFRFLQGFEAVTMTLSGMSNMAQLEENIRTFSEEKPLNDKEFDEVMKIVDRMIEKSTVPCTSCRYCVEKCPRSIDIPTVLGAYNEYIKTQDKDFILDLDKKKSPATCIGCRQCEKLCPQGIKISEMMKKIAGIIG
jgi:predicted aldo/keto reductase-like oxidoreductase